MNLYPALRAQMGTWDYYIIKMKMSDLVKEVDFASKLYESKTLDDAIQRTLNEGRVKSEIVNYLAKRSDRFFSSLVVATLGGNPTFTPVRITDDERFAVLKAGNVDEAFGVLTFDGGQRYFALDGQHRLKSIKTLIEGGSGGDVPPLPPGFLEEEVSVIMLVREEADDEEFLRSYRRLFSSLNRYAKPTDQDTNIIMDEDDWAAILTRRLLTEHEFFFWEGKATESPKLKTKGKGLKSGDSFFTTLQTLYAMNEALLMTPQRDHQKFHSRQFKFFNPGETLLDEMFDELVTYWDAMLAEIPELASPPERMRSHGAHEDASGKLSDSVLFWPIGQELFARVVRLRMSRCLPDSDNPQLDEVRECIRVFSKVDWSLRAAPWRGLLITQDPNGSWKMRSEDRKEAIRIAEAILRVQTGVDELPPDGLEELKTDWYAMLIPRPDKDDVDATWDQVARSLT
ncbi:MAG: DGQHR domain-containing protein [Gammaproteobacteria bacterium]|nr:DGQHR domain-containing protein [Gammaproteobacteria bacterium]